MPSDRGMFRLTARADALQPGDRIHIPYTKPGSTVEVLAVSPQVEVTYEVGGRTFRSLFPADKMVDADRFAPPAPDELFRNL